MNIRNILRYIFMLMLTASVVSWYSIASAEDTTEVSPAVRDAMQMPVLTGHVWQKLSADSKIAFVWGVGHVVTIEKHVEVKHPELKRSDFTAKLSEGLTGVPMSDIVKHVDDYYTSHPDSLDTPVMKVIWRQLVKPKLSSGIADMPIVKDSDTK